VSGTPYRFCGAELRQSFVDLGRSPLANAFLAPDELRRMEPFYPLHAYVCRDCTQAPTGLSTPRSKRSVQRFCEQGHLDCVCIRGPRGDQFFHQSRIGRALCEKLRQIEAVASSATMRPMTGLSQTLA
jgi:hypothetical protein